MGFTHTASSIDVANSAVLAAAIAAAVTPPPSAAAIGAAVGGAVPVPPSAAAIGLAVPQPTAIGTAVGIAVPQPADFTVAGSRLVDTAASNTSFTLNLSTFTSPSMNFANAISYAMQISAAIPGGSSAASQGLVTLNLSWYDVTGTILYASQEYEINVGGGGVPISTQLLDRALGPILVVSFAGYMGAVSAVQMNFNVITSSRPTDRPLIYEHGGGSSAGNSYDGQLGSVTGNLAAGATAPVLYCALGVGMGQLAMSAGASGASNLIRFGLVFGTGPISFSRTFAPNPSDNLEQILMVNRPLVVTITNVGTVSSNYYFKLWTQGD